MQVPLIDLKAQYNDIKQEVDAAVHKVMDSQYFVLSQDVSELEKEISDYCGCECAAGVASGTDALILALKAAGVGKGDMVITTPFSFFATAEAVSILGARPMFVDIDPRTFNISPESISAALSSITDNDRAKVKCILPVHIYGRCAPMGDIDRIAGENGLFVIEDCAQAIGSALKGKKAGSMGLAGCFSFFPSKNLGGFGDGGMVVSSDRALIQHIKKLRVHGMGEQYIHDEIGFNSRLDSIQAAVLRVKLKKLDTWIEGRNKVAARYNRAFSDLGIRTPSESKDNEHSFHQYTIAVDERDELLDHLNSNGIAARVYYPVPLHLQPCYSELGHRQGDLPEAERACGSVLSLPVYPELSDDMIDHVIAKVRQFFE